METFLKTGFLSADQIIATLMVGDRAGGTGYGARPPAPCGTCHNLSGAAIDDAAVSLMAMSKRTSRQKANARRKKANHGRKPNFGRNS